MQEGHALWGRPAVSGRCRGWWRRTLTLYRYAYRLSGAAADAEDLTQEAFCKAQARFAQLRNPAAPVPGCSASSATPTCTASAQSAMHCVSLDDVGDLPEPSPEALPEVDPEQLQQALNELSEVYRTPLILYYFGEFSYREIAEQMDLPIGTVMSKLARAKAWLRTRLLPTAAASPVRRATDGL